ncbi:hypothetical protein IAR55_001656 [Kwoniella newhampshirensis]|uniref:ubiquitinyl hydrolase 1 n=1 Tax=Kwoniella newhampshirensis TaxID=1651941 RepID=A0AAW0Z2N2_9TREE
MSGRNAIRESPSPSVPRSTSIFKLDPLSTSSSTSATTVDTHSEEDESPPNSPTIVPSRAAAGKATPSIPIPTKLLGYLPRPFDDYLVLLISLFAQSFLTLYDMALGLSSWWSGNAAASAVRGGEKLEMVERRDGKVVKRRRRKVDSPRSNGTVIVNGYFPGMVNLSGTLCYMNSVLQAFASMSSLVEHLEKIVLLALEVDMPTLVTDALLEVIHELNTSHQRPPPALRPNNLLYALQPLPAIRRLLSTREQQDAHELFVILAEAVSDEAVKVAAEVAKLRGFADVLSLQGYVNNRNGNGNVSGRADKEGAKKRDKIRGVAQPWEGLMARRRVCQKCGWSEAIRLDTLGGMELPVPLHGDATLDACIAEYLAPELLSDVTCEFCSVRLTLEHYKTDVERLSAPASSSSRKPKFNGTPLAASGSYSALEGLPTELPNDISQMTNSRKKRARDARRVENRLQEMLESNTITGFGDITIHPLPNSSSTAPIPIKWQTSRTSSVRQGIITRPPQSLRLHFIRSEFTPYGAVLKKTARVAFPMIMDLTRFVADGVWEERSDVRGMVANVATNNITSKPSKRILYRLESAILHYGYTHSSGHFICIRRKPTPAAHSNTRYRPKRVNRSCPDECGCESCAYFGPVRQDLENVPGKGWLRVSDADVEEVGEEALYEARGAVFMLFYDRVGYYVDKGEKVEGNETHAEGD